MARLNRLDTRVLGDPAARSPQSRRAASATLAFVAIALVICTATGQPGWIYIAIPFVGAWLKSVIQKYDRRP
jgi:hypothetical protein